MPGRYDIGLQQLQLPPFVDIEGSGERSTTIAGNASVLISMSSSELRSLTVEAAGSYTGIEVNGGSAKFTDFTLNLLRGYVGMWTLEAELSMRNVTVFVDAGGSESPVYGLIIENHAGIPAADLDNMKIQTANLLAGTGLLAHYGGANVVLRNGKVTAGIMGYGMTIKNSDVDGVDARGMTIVASKIGTMLADEATRVSFSEIDGIISGTGMSCFSVHDQNYNAVTCP
jgi:hypothetical protein